MAGVSRKPGGGPQEGSHIYRRIFCSSVLFGLHGMLLVRRAVTADDNGRGFLTLVEGMFGYAHRSFTMGQDRYKCAKH